MKIFFSEKAKIALQKGVKNGDCVADLELIGLNLRTISILDDYGIITLEDLLLKNQADLRAIPSIGGSAMRELLECLGKYHELEKKRARIEAVSEYIKKGSIRKLETAFA